MQYRTTSVRIALPPLPFDYGKRLLTACCSCLRSILGHFKPLRRCRSGPLSDQDALNGLLHRRAPRPLLPWHPVGIVCDRGSQAQCMHPPLRMHPPCAYNRSTHGSVHRVRYRFVMLSFGVILVQSQDSKSSSAPTGASPTIGVVAALCAATLSGFAVPDSDRTHQPWAPCDLPREDVHNRLDVLYLPTLLLALLTGRLPREDVHNRLDVALDAQRAARHLCDPAAGKQV